MLRTKFIDITRGNPLKQAQEWLARHAPGTLVPSRLWTPSKGQLCMAGHPLDPMLVGYDMQPHQTLGVIEQQSDVLDYASAGNDSIRLPKNAVITGLLLVADPYRHDVTTAAITVVQDAVDKVLQGLTIAGRTTYFQLNSNLAYLKALSAMNKVVYGGGIMHENLATAVGADHDSRQAWYIPFGLDDYDYFDARTGIPAEDDEVLINGTFGANNVIAETAANGTVDTATDIYAIVFGVTGLSRAYRSRLPIPDFKHQHNTAPATQTTFNLQGGRWLKRTTILNLAVAANNNEPRNDGNVTDVSIVFNKPVTSRLVSDMRWQLFKAINTMFGRGPENDRDGSVAVLAQGLDGVAVIDWRRITKNPYGLNLMGLSDGDAQITLEMATTTGSVHMLHEYYNPPDPSVPVAWEGRFRPQ